MELILKRTRLRDTITTGQLYLNGEFLMFTLEDRVLEKPGVPVQSWKVKGESAIPYGEYLVELEDSPRFGPETPTLRNVPGFTHIRIHAGNTAADTEGCIIVGYRVRDDGIIIPGTSRPAVNDLKAIIRRADEKVTIRITV